MRVDFFEEFPTKENLDKLKFVTWPSTIYVACKSVKEFRSIVKGHGKKGLKFSWWPILEKKEGYWLSPFSSHYAVKRVIDDAIKNKVDVMWDAELPFRHPWLFFRWDNFVRNKRAFEKFFSEYGSKIISAEYPMKNQFVHWWLTFMGVSFSPKKYGNSKIVMYYTSMHKSVKSLLLYGVNKMHGEFGSKLHVGLGTIATGILGDEPILSVSDLERDLEEMKKIGVSRVCMFRLGGMNLKYSRVLKKYVD